jgi:hypothetical protein
VTEDAGKNVEKEKHCYIAGGIASWYNHSGNHSGGSSNILFLKSSCNTCALDIV